MIFAKNNQRHLGLTHDSPLMRYLIKERDYDDSKLEFMVSGNTGTWTTSNKNSSLKGDIKVNGYPHFRVPIAILVDEIESYINGSPIYSGDSFYVRFGDTHTHSVYPKLSQLRNIFLGDIIKRCVADTGGKISLEYFLGDVSHKVYALVNQRNSGCDGSGETCIPMRLFKNPIYTCEHITRWRNLSELALTGIRWFLTNLGIKPERIVFESDLYDDLTKIRNLMGPILDGGLIRADGSFKYLLQEIHYLSRIEGYGRVISVVGNNQIDHVCKVLDFITKNKLIVNPFYLVPGVCENGNSRNIDEWTKQLSDFIEQNNINTQIGMMTPSQLLRIIFVSTANDRVIDFGNLNRYKKNIWRYLEIERALNQSREAPNSAGGYTENPFFNMMALANYYTHLSIDRLHFNHLFEYLHSMSREYLFKIENRAHSRMFSGLLNRGMTRLGLLDESKEIKTRQAVSDNSEVQNDLSK